MNSTTQTAAPTATQSLVARMLSFDGNFDGYPSMYCEDEGLVFAAVAENADQESDLPTVSDGDGVVLMSYLASEYVTTREQLKSCRNFITAFVDSAWLTNMTEGSNPIFNEMVENGEEV